MTNGSGHDKHGGKVDGKSAGAESSWLRARFDPHYSASHGEQKPWSDTITTARRTLPIVPGDFSWVQQLRDKQAAELKLELRLHLQVMPSGQRIRNLRTVLGWTQRTTAVELRVSARTVIRLEQARNHATRPRWSLLKRLRELESEHAEQLITYFGAVRP